MLRFLWLMILVLGQTSLHASDREDSYSSWVTQHLHPWFQSQPDQYLTSKPGSPQAVRLRYKTFIKDKARAQIVIVHGYGERIEKLMEMAYDFYQAGFSVYLYDQRGYGRSTRLNPNGADAIYVDKFDHYVQDLEQVLTGLVPRDDSKPTFLFAHSMGGLVTAWLIHKRPDLVAGAILSAPMFSIMLHGVPRPVALLLADLATALGYGGAYAFGQVGAHPLQFDEASGTSSQIRWEPYADFYNSPEEWPLALGGASFQWLGEALRSSMVMDDPAWVSQVKVPVLLFQADKDTFVSAEGQNSFCSGAPRCRKVFVPNTRHEIYREKDEARSAYLQEIWQFLDEQLKRSRAP